ncbi:hypothetical protein I3842_Q058100 [Carya illinoinensis]|uniref:Protein kinase domain-containing protein n=1 Tax=Carya illinoinensis TaxID=32201 RepID=A0A922D0E6_CARIL|nr:hypothetical protein I3842_Q058100 [Carya illinoinensis]
MASRSNNNSRTRVGKYELGRTLGAGNFAKVKFARNVETGENVAIKILDKEKVLKHKMIGQIKREISTMKLIRHPNVIRSLCFTARYWRWLARQRYTLFWNL